MMLFIDSNPSSNVRQGHFNRGGRPSRFFPVLSRDAMFLAPEWQRITKGLLPDESVLVEQLSLKAGDSKPLALIAKGLICEIKERMMLARDAKRYDELAELAEDAGEIVEKAVVWGCLTSKEASVYNRLLAEI